MTRDGKAILFWLLVWHALAWHWWGWWGLGLSAAWCGFLLLALLCAAGRAAGRANDIARRSQRR